MSIFSTIKPMELRIMYLFVFFVQLKIINCTNLHKDLKGQFNQKK